MEKSTKKSHVDHVAALFGGRVALAKAIGVHHSLLTHWNTRKSAPGHIPPRYNASILKAAAKLKIADAEIGKYIDANVCPVCNQLLPAKAMIHRNTVTRVRQMARA